ncbi:MAG: hypothetical protein ACXVCE_14580 [Bacteriovorax sp.]
MKKALFLILLAGLSTKTFSSEPLSQFDENCRLIYRSAYLKLSSDVDGFNKKILSKYEMSSRLAALSIEITASQGNCEQLKADDNAKCTFEYKELYSHLRNKINISEILSGKQSKIDRGHLNSDKAKEAIRLRVIDSKCKS